VECPSAFLLADIANPARTVFIVELSEMKGRTDSPMIGDHVMPQYWGSPPRVADAEMQARQWDPETQRPKTVAYRRHNGGSNYVFADGHARWLRFEQTFQQQVGLTPEVDLYDPGRR
jgi:prepilin-type processing-associated H-X9-DG protein